MSRRSIVWLGVLGLGSPACGLAEKSSPSDQTTLTAVSSALTAAEVEPFAPPTLWTTGGVTAENGMYLADVTGPTTNAADGKLDLVVVNNGNIKVRPATGSSFAPAQTWSSTAFLGQKTSSAICGAISCVNFFADVTGDDRADAIIVQNGGISVRRARTSVREFDAATSWTANQPFFGTRATFFADVNGDKKADAIAVNDNDVQVRLSDGTRFVSAGATADTWFVGTSWGTRGTFVADLNADKKADLIAVNDNDIRVQLTRNNLWTLPDIWSSTGGVGSRGTFFADVTSDGLPDLINVTDTGVVMRRNGRWFFNVAVETMSSSALATTAFPAVGDVTGDQPPQADFLRLDKTAGADVAVQVRKLRRIPIRLVQFVESCVPFSSSVHGALDDNIENTIAVINDVFKETGLEFYAQDASGPDCLNLGYHKSHIVQSTALANLNGNARLPDSEIPKAVPYNPNCSIGIPDLAGEMDREQMWMITDRCAPSGEIIVHIANHFASRGLGPGVGKAVIWTPNTDMLTRSPGNQLYAHELGHFFGLQHPIGVHPGGPVEQAELIYPTSSYFDTETAQFKPMSASWDLVMAANGSGPVTFNSRAEAAQYETSLRGIQDWADNGWYCQYATDPVTQPCPSTYPTATIGVRANGTGQVWYSGDQKLKGLGLRYPADGFFAVNIMTYGYDPATNNPLRQRSGFSLSQIDQINSALKNDLPLPLLSTSGQVLFGDRPRLGMTGPAPAVRYVNTGAWTPTQVGTLATNKYNTWMLGFNTYDANGFDVFEWNPRTLLFDRRMAGAKRIALPSGGENQPWAITGAVPGPVKRWNGTTFANLPGGNGCARALAAGNRPGGTYAWNIGCGTPNAIGNYPVERYDDQTGWQPTSGQGSQIAVASDGTPWTLGNAPGGGKTIFEAVLDANGFPTNTWIEHAPPTGVTPQYLSSVSTHWYKLYPNFLGTNGHVYTWNGSAWNDANIPPVTMGQIAGSLPYLWAAEPSGAVWYQR